MSENLINYLKYNIGIIEKHKYENFLMSCYNNFQRFFWFQ